VTDLPPLTWLYVPADRPDRVEKALASSAHAVIVDLEDAVARSAKNDARANLKSLFAAPREQRVLVRVNAPSTEWGRADLDAVAALHVDGVSIPKVASPGDVGAVASVLGERFRLHCLIESAAGVEAAFEIARHPRVGGISLGEADLRGETGASGAGLDWARGRIVNAAAAAGLPRPPQSVYPHVQDLDGLADACAHARELGFLGGTAIHPAQLPVIERSYLPSDDEATDARALVARFERATSGAFAIEGAFVDAAIVRSARQILALADRYGTRG
jgi:citrate lyase subunit beta / citryl-CoA lyase